MKKSKPRPVRLSREISNFYEDFLPVKVALKLHKNFLFRLPSVYASFAIDKCTFKKLILLIIALSFLSNLVSLCPV